MLLAPARLRTTWGACLPSPTPFTNGFKLIDRHCPGFVSSLRPGFRQGSLDCCLLCFPDLHRIKVLIQQHHQDYPPIPLPMRIEPSIWLRLRLLSRQRALICNRRSTPFFISRASYPACRAGVSSTPRIRAASILGNLASDAKWFACQSVIILRESFCLAE